MRVGRVTLVLVSLTGLFVLVAPTAFADRTSRDYTATFREDPNASMSFSVRFDDQGRATRLSRVHYENVDITCPDGSSSERSATVEGSRIRRPHDGPIYLSGGGVAEDNFLSSMVGTLRRSGERASGYLVAWENTGPGGCTTTGGSGPSPKLHWTAAAR